MKVLIIDNYDSFTYNLVYLVRAVTGMIPDVKRNDQFTLDEIKNYDKLLLSPGPGVPSEAGLLMSVLDSFASEKSILGVCLGHQAIGSFYGGRLENMSSVVHGLETPIKQIVKDELFENVPEKFNAGRYHSWIVSKEEFPQTLEILAEDEDGLIMALRHKTLDVKGVQFHPESIMTKDGEQMIRNWLKQ